MHKSVQIILETKIHLLIVSRLCKNSALVFSNGNNINSKPHLQYVNVSRERDKGRTILHSHMTQNSKTVFAVIRQA